MKSCSFQCSSRTILQLVKNGSAAYVLHVECSNTFYRHAFEFSDARGGAVVDRLHNVAAADACPPPGGVVGDAFGMEAARPFHPPDAVGG